MSDMLAIARSEEFQALEGECRELRRAFNSVDGFLWSLGLSSYEYVDGSTIRLVDRSYGPWVSGNVLLLSSQVIVLAALSLEARGMPVPDHIAVLSVRVLLAGHVRVLP